MFGLTLEEIIIDNENYTEIIEKRLVNIKDKITKLVKLINISNIRSNNYAGRVNNRKEKKTRIKCIIVGLKYV